MATKDTFLGTRKAVYGEIVRKDCYMLQKWPTDFFDYIIDIGANVGVFCLYAHMRHPKAKIFAYEPCKDTFDYLVENNSFIDNIDFVMEALGDGSILFFCDSGFSGCNQFFKGDERECISGYKVESKTLYSIFKEKNISLNSRYFIKIDCEGGERFLIDDVKSIEVISRSMGCSMEVHFPPVGNNLRGEEVERYNTFPKWEVYNEWLNKNFNNTHDIIYHYSSKRRGVGIFVLSKKSNGE